MVQNSALARPVPLWNPGVKRERKKVEEHRGACLCGAVRFSTSGALRGVVYCHCNQCRKQSGHFYAATNVADEKLSVEGAANLTWYSASAFAKRGFCRHCGSVLFWKHDGLDVTSVMAGAFEAPSGLRAEAHIFTADKGDYYAITDDLPQFPGSMPGIVVAADLTASSHSASGERSVSAAEPARDRAE